MSDFKEFISGILSLAGIGQKNISVLTSNENLEQFRIAFTHKTVATNGENNYELYEFVGDSLVNTALVGYIRSEKPEITDVETLTRIKHLIQSRTFLSRLAFQNGFFDKSVIGEEFANSILEQREQKMRKFQKEQKVATEETKKKIVAMGEEFLFNNKIFLKLMTDLYEAVCGVISFLVEKEKKIQGIGYVPVYNLTSTLLKRSNIELSYENVVDPITRLKETYDRIKYIDTASGEERKWNLSKMQETKRLPNGKFLVEIYGYFGKTRNPEIDQRVVLASATASESKEAKREAAQRGLESLQKYGLREYKKLGGGGEKRTARRG